MRILALTKRVIRQFARDKRTMALILVAPSMMLVLMSVVFNGDSYQPSIATVEAPAIMVSALKNANAEVEEMTEKDAKSALENAEIDAILRMEGMSPSVVFEGSDPAKTTAVQIALRDAMTEMNPQAQPSEMETSFLHGSAESSSFDTFGPVLLGFLIFFFTFIVSGVAFVKERTSGTLERMFSTPLRRWELVLGYALGFAAVVMVQSTLLSVVSVYGLDMQLNGSFALLLVTNLSLALTALALGMFLSAFAKSEFQLVQFIPVVIVPQIFFTGIFPVESMASWLQNLAKIMPLTYGAEALKEIMVRGNGIEIIAQPLMVLITLTMVLFIANVRALRAYRTV